MGHRKRNQSRVAALALTVALAFTCATAVVAGPAAADGGCTTCTGLGGGPPTGEGNQDNGSVVTTGIQFPGVSEDSDLGRATSEAAHCTDCQWTISPACLANGPEDDALCLGATIACDAPAILYRVYMRHGDDGAWEFKGSTCLGPGDKPASASDVGQIVRERVETYLPDAAPSFQPAEGGLVNLPTLFASGEPESITTEPFDVLGFTVVVTAKARWVWEFDSGVTQDFDKPGGAYPNDDVAFTYQDAGTRDVTVTTYWDASFTIDGAGPYQVPGPEISKTAGPMTVPVREAQSELVGG